jgi:hypothetical protein
MGMTEPMSPEEQAPWNWPFSRSKLTAGIRRYKQDTSLQVESVQTRPVPHQRPAIGSLQGLAVTYRGNHGGGELHLVVKEPHGSTRTGLAGAGRREVGIYESLASQLPLRTPSLICAGSGGDWLLLEDVQQTLQASDWSADDYVHAVKALASLHDRFWDLGDDLDAFPWLGRPLGADFEVHVTVAAQAIQRIVTITSARVAAWDPERLQLLARLIVGANKVAAPLRRLPKTLLHGDYWPGNIAVLEDGSQAVYDWQLAAIGPAVLDLLVFVKNSRWYFGGMPVDEADLVRLYRDEIKNLTGVVWDDAAWQEQWEHAMIWRFLQEWLDLIAASPESLLTTRARELDEIWLQPVTDAIERRLELK